MSPPISWKVWQTFNDALSVSEVHKAPVVKHYKVSDSRSELPLLKHNAIEFEGYAPWSPSPTSCESGLNANRAQSLDLPSITGKL